MYQVINTLASYYRAAENPHEFFSGWINAEFMAWMIVGRKNKGYKQALERLYESLNENEHPFQDMLLEELKSL